MSERTRLCIAVDVDANFSLLQARSRGTNPDIGHEDLTGVSQVSKYWNSTCLMDFVLMPLRRGPLPAEDASMAFYCLRGMFHTAVPLVSPRVRSRSSSVREGRINKSRNWRSVRKAFAC